VRCWRAGLQVATFVPLQNDSALQEVGGCAEGGIIRVIPLGEEASGIGALIDRRLDHTSPPQNVEQVVSFPPPSMPAPLSVISRLGTPLSPPARTRHREGGRGRFPQVAQQPSRSRWTPVGSRPFGRVSKRRRGKRRGWIEVDRFRNKTEGCLRRTSRVDLSMPRYLGEKKTPLFFVVRR